MNRSYYIFLLGLAISILWTAWILAGVGTGTNYILSDPDAYLHAWNLWWVKTSLLDLVQSPYWTNYNGYPTGVSLIYHQLILPLGIVSIPFFSMGFHSGELLAVWQYVLPVIGYIGTFLLIRSSGGSKTGALFAGLYIIFTPIAWENMARPDSLSYLLIPWLLLTILWMNKRSILSMVAPIFLVTALVLMSPYYAAGLGILWLLTIPFCNQFGIERYQLIAIYPAGVLIAAFEWLPQVVGTNPNLVSSSVIEAFSADLTGIFLPHPHFWWVPESQAFWHDYWTAGIHSSIYPGWIALVVALCGVKKLTRKTKIWLLLVVATFFIISLGPGIRIMGQTYWSGYLPYGIAMNVFDPIRAFRIPLRFGYFLLILIPIGIGLHLKNTKISIFIGILILVELIRFPLSVRPLPNIDKLREVPRKIKTEGLIPIPLTDWASEAQFGQTIHEKKFPLEGISYTPDRVWNTISENKVLSSLFEQKNLPSTGWSELRPMGFGGVILHREILREDRAQMRKGELVKFLGEPVYRAERFELYRIPKSFNP